MHFGPRLGQFDPIKFFAKYHTLSIPMTHTTTKLGGGLMMTITARSRLNGFAPNKEGRDATSS